MNEIPVFDPIAETIPAFDANAPAQDVTPAEVIPPFNPSSSSEGQYTLADIKAATPQSLADDKDFAPIRFSVANETELQNDPEAQNKVAEAYAIKERRGSTLLQKGGKAVTGFIPALKRLYTGVTGAIEMPQAPFIRAGKAVLKGTPEAIKGVIQEEVGRLAAIPASVESNVASYLDLGKGFVRAGAETVKGIARAVTGPGSISEAASSLGKSELTPEEFRVRYFSDLGSAKAATEAAKGQGPALEALGADAKNLADIGITVDPEKIQELSILTDPINFVPFGAAVGVVGKFGKSIVATTLSAEQAAKLAVTLNAAKDVAATTGGAGLTSIGRTAEQAGVATAQNLRKIGGGFGAVGLGHFLGQGIYTSLAVAKGIPKVVEIAGRITKRVGKAISGKEPLSAPAALATQALGQGAIGLAEGAVLTAPFVIGSRTEDEEGLLGMIPIAGLARAGHVVAPAAVRATGEGLQNKLASEIFRTVEQAPAPETPSYGTAPELDVTHTESLTKLDPQSQKFVNLFRSKFEGSPIEIYSVDRKTMEHRSGNENASGFAIESGEKTNPDGTKTPVFRILLNESTSALPHEAYHAFEFLEPTRARAFEKTVADNLTPQQLKNFGDTYDAALNLGKPEASWNRLTDQGIAREVAAEAFSRIITGQDLSGVPPSVRKQASLFASGLLEKIGAPLAKLGAAKEVGGSLIGGVRSGTSSVKLGQEWINGLFDRLDKEGALVPTKPAVQSVPPVKPTQLQLPLSERVPPAQPAAIVPPVAPILPVITPEAQRATVTGASEALAAAAKLGPEVTARVNELVGHIESGKPVLEIEHSGVKSEGTPEEPLGRTARRAEQEAPDFVREIYGKGLVPDRLVVVGGKPQLLAMSLDKVVTNINRAVKDAAIYKVEGLIPYESKEGKLTDAGWREATADLQAYSKNQANGFQGGGDPLIRPATDVGLSIPAETPGYVPTKISPERADFQNLIQGLATPLTSREVKGQIPGNVKGQVLAEANLRKLETPAAIRPENIAKQEFKSQPGRSLKEVNPLRNKLAEAGVPVRELEDVTERINVQNILSMKPRPDVQFNAPVTDIIRGGFSPAIPGNKFWLDPQGNLHEVVEHEPWAKENISNAPNFMTAAFDKGWVRVNVTPEDGSIFIEAKYGRQIPRNQKQSLEDLAFQHDLPVIDDAGKTLITKPNLPGAFSPKPQESVADYGQRILEMDDATFASTMNASKGGLTGLAYDTGLALKDKADLTILKGLADTANAAAQTAMANKDFAGAMPLVMRGQFFREALEAATNTGSAATMLPRLRPGETSPFKAGDFQPKEDLSPIKEAATRTPGGEIFTGAWHGESRMKLAEAIGKGELKEPVPHTQKSIEDFGDDGFITQSGEFLNRQEAFERAAAIKQIKVAEDEKAMPSYRWLESNEFEARRAFAPKPKKLVEKDYEKYAATGKSTGPTLTGWILPNGKFTDLQGNSFHEAFLAKNAENLNKKFGTAFSTASGVEDRLAALNKGFVRMRQDSNGATHVELNSKFWTPKNRRIVENQLLDNVDNVGNIYMNLLDNEGRVVDANVIQGYNLPEGTTPEAAIHDGLLDLRGGSAAPFPLAKDQAEVRGRLLQLVNEGKVTREFWLNSKNGEIVLAPDGHEIAAMHLIGDTRFAQDAMYNQGFVRGVRFGDGAIHLNSGGRGGPDVTLSASAKRTMATISDSYSEAPVFLDSENTGIGAEAPGGSAAPFPLAKDQEITGRLKQLVDDGKVTSQFWINSKNGEILLAPDGHEEAAMGWLPQETDKYWGDQEATNEMYKKGFLRAVRLNQTSGHRIIILNDGGPGFPKLNLSQTAKKTLGTLADSYELSEIFLNGEPKPAGSFSPSEENLPGLKLPSEEQGAQIMAKRKIKRAKDNFPEAIVPTFQKSGAGDFLMGDDGKPKSVAIEYNLDETPVAKDAMKGIRGESERRDAVASALATGIEKTYKQAIKNPEIKAGEKWYSTARSRLKKIFGDDTKFFSELLGATSARTPVDTNYGFALDAYNKFRSGEYDDLIKTYREGKQKWDTLDIADYTKDTKNENPTRGQFIDWWVEKNDLLPRQSNGRKFGMNSRAVLRVLDGSWREEVQGPKTPNFAGNLSGDTFQATIDIWAARLLHRLANEGNTKRWRILPENETGVTDPDFHLGQAAFKKAADKLGIKPDALQAVLWFGEKNHWEKNGWTRGSGAKKSDFNVLLQETESLPTGQKKMQTPQKELGFELKSEYIKKK